jgi:hypothetical protein
LEGKLADIWEQVHWNVLQSVLFGWMERVEWVIGHEGNYCFNPHSLNKNPINRSREKQGAITFVTSDTVSGTLIVFLNWWSFACETKVNLQWDSVGENVLFCQCLMRDEHITT